MKKWKLQWTFAVRSLHEDDISDSFEELARILMKENDLRIPTNPVEAENLYCELLCLIDDI